VPPAPPAFSEFHALSAFSFLRGASQPEVLVRRAAELGYRSIAITAAASTAAPGPTSAATEAGLRTIVGTTLTLPDHSRHQVLCATRELF
jgi:error-prone DNA polymerase